MGPKKRIFEILLIIGAAFLAWGCSKSGGGTESKGEDKETAAETEVSEIAGPKIGVSIYRYDDNFMKVYRSELKQYLGETYQAEVLMRNAGGSQEEQNRQVAEFISEGCDGIIINPVEVSSAGEIADECSQAGIPLVFINREPGEEEKERWKKNHMEVACVGTDSRQAGTYQGEIILETGNKGDVNGDGIVSYAMIMGEEENEDSSYRSEYSVKALEDGGMNTEELFSGHGDWDKNKGKKLAQSALSTYGTRIEVFFCSNDAMADGALEAVEEAGMIPGKDVYLVGVDALEDTVAAVKTGKITGTVFNDHESQSKAASDALIKMINGEETDTRYLVDYIKITAISTFQKEEQ